MSLSKILSASATLFLAGTPALAEVCDKIAPYWAQGDLAIPAPAMLIVAAIIGLAAGALAGAVRTVWLVLCILPLALSFWLEDNAMGEFARAEGCQPDQLVNAAILLAAATFPALILFVILRRPH